MFITEQYDDVFKPSNEFYAGWWFISSQGDYLRRIGRDVYRVYCNL